MALKRFLLSKNTPLVFCTKIITCCSGSEEKHRGRQISPNSGACREEKGQIFQWMHITATGLLLPAHGCQVFADCHTAHCLIGYMPLALLRACRSGVCTDTGKQGAQMHLFPEHHPCPIKIHGCLMRADQSDTHLDSQLNWSSLLSGEGVHHTTMDDLKEFSSELTKEGNLLLKLSSIRETRTVSCRKQSCRTLWGCQKTFQ